MISLTATQTNFARCIEVRFRKIQILTGLSRFLSDMKGWPLACPDFAPARRDCD
jgi:hypothetical protein